MLASCGSLGLANCYTNVGSSVTDDVLKVFALGLYHLCKRLIDSIGAFNFCINAVIHFQYNTSHNS